MIENWNVEIVRSEKPPEASGAERDPIEALAEDYLDRLRRGESPDVAGYAARHPELADEICDLFPTLAMLEKVTPEERPIIPPSLPDSDVPARLGEYQIRGEIGRGGMGIVYEAVHQTMRRRVALKVLPKQLASRGKHLKRFLRETRAAGNLHHTNIVPIFEVGSAQGWYFYSMQYIHGQNLDSVIEELRKFQEPSGDFPDATTRVPGGTPPKFAASASVAWHLLSGAWQTHPGSASSEEPDSPHSEPDPTQMMTDRAETTEASPGPAKPIVIPKKSEFSKIGETGEGYFRRVARVGLQVAEALHYAHSQGVLHRDIKPSNLLLDIEGVAWVTDFGLAKHEGDDFTHTGDIVGTLRYMAPERFQGRADVRSDVYGLGLTLYELCTFRYAFEQSDRAQLIQTVTHSSPPRPRAINPAIPRDLETIILKAIDREPSHRYQTAEHLAEDLRLFVLDHPIRARRASLRERLWRWCRRNPAQALLASWVALLLVVLAAVSLWSAFASYRHAKELEQENQRATLAEQTAREATRTATLALYESHLGRAHAGRWSHRPGQHFSSLSALSEAAKILPTLDLEPDEYRRQNRMLRDEAIAAMPLIDVREIKTWPVEKGWTGVVAFTSQYDIYAHSDNQGNITIRRVDDDRELQALTGPGVRAWILRFSPDGRYLAGKFHNQDTPAVLWVWELQTGRIVLECDEKSAIPNTMAFAPKGGRLAVISADRALRIYELPEGQPVFEKSFPAEMNEVCFSPSGAQVAVATGAGGFLVDVPPGRDSQGNEEKSLETVPLLPAESLACIAWNGPYVSAGTAGGLIHVWDAGKPQSPVHALEGHLARVVQLNASHNGELLFSRSWDGTSRMWDLRRASEILRMDFLSPMRSPFSPDDRYLSFAGPNSTFGIWELALGGPLQILGAKAGKSSRWMAVFHPAVPHVLATATGQGVQFWDIRTGRLLEVLPSQYSQAVLFTPDGKFVITSGSMGLNEWPIEIHPGEAEPIRIGPRRPLLSETTGRASIDARGRHVAVALGHRQAIVVDRDEPAKNVPLAPHAGLDRAVLSPDGRWVATATWQGNGIRIWDRETGQMLENLLPEVGSATPAFSPDGKWLGVGTGEAHYLWDTETWECRHRIPRELADGWPGHVAFSPDSRLAAFAHTHYSVQILDVATGERIAILEPPQRAPQGWFAFSDDGRRLVITEDDLVQIWDWDQIQGQLKQMGLD